MTWMNETEIENAYARFAGHGDLGPAVRTLYALVQVTNANSDGWHSWPKPARAADRLMQMIQDASWRPEDYRYREPTTKRLRSALVPVKAFRTRMTAEHGDRWNFGITERLPTRREELGQAIMAAERKAAAAAELADRWLAEAKRLSAELADEMEDRS